MRFKFSTQTFDFSTRFRAAYGLVLYLNCSKMKFFLVTSIMNVYSRSSKISTQFTLNIRKMWTFQVLSEYFKLWVALGLPPRFPLPGFLCLSVCRVFWTVRVTVSTKTKRYSRILVQNQTSNVHKHRMWSVKAEKSTATPPGFDRHENVSKPCFLSPVLVLKTV